MPGHGKDHSFLPDLFLPLLPCFACPGASTWAQPIILTHTICPVARPRFIFGTFWKVSLFPAGRNAWFERGLLQWREGP